MINFEQHVRDLEPVDWNAALSGCVDLDLRIVEHAAAVLGESRHPGVRAGGDALFRQVQHERARRVAEQGRMDAQFWTAVETVRPPVEEPDLTGIPKWSEVSTPEVDRP